MANRKLSDEQIAQLLDGFDNGESPSKLAIHFNISPSTVSRVLKTNNRNVSVRLAHRVMIEDKVKSRLRKVLSGYGISNPDFLISRLDEEFIIDIRNRDETPIIYV